MLQLAPASTPRACPAAASPHQDHDSRFASSTRSCQRHQAQSHWQSLPPVCLIASLLFDSRHHCHDNQSTSQPKSAAPQNYTIPSHPSFPLRHRPQASRQTKQVPHDDCIANDFQAAHRTLSRPRPYAILSNCQLLVGGHVFPGVTLVDSTAKRGKPIGS